MFINLVKKSYNAVIQNPSITLFLVLFLILSNFLASCMATTKMTVIAIIVMICLFVLFGAFLAGWFQVVKESVDIEKIKEKNYTSVFFEGVGKNILSVLLGVIIYFAVFILIFFLTKEFAHHVFGSLDFLFKDIAALSQDHKSVMEYLKSLSDSQKYIIYAWQFSFIISMCVFYFLLLFYFPSIIYQEKNVFIKPFYAVYDSIKRVFKNFFSVLLLYIFIQVTHFIVAFANTFFASNVFISVLFLFFYIYFASFVVVLIFNCYEAQSNCNNRCNSIEQNSNCD